MYESSSPRPRHSRPAPPKFNLKDEVRQALASDDVLRKRKFVETLAAETESDIADVAAALLFLLEAQRRTHQSRPPRKPFPAERSQEQGRQRYERGSFRSGRRDQSAERRDQSAERRDQSAGRPSSGRRASGAMTKYRIEVGRAHGVGPGQIVGALANESELSGADIGGIDIQTHFSTVDLPNNMSAEMVRGLGQLRVAGQALRLSKWERGGDARLEEKPKRFQRKRGGKPSWKKPRSGATPQTSG